MDDREIVGLYLDRDEAALRETDKKYGSLCRTIAMNILGSREDSEECVSDTYLRAWNTIPPQKPNILSAYLGRITRNLSFDRFRRMTAEKRGGGQTGAVLEELAECVSGRESVENEIDKKELAADINSFLHSLPEKKRSIFLCRCWYALPIPEIARRCGMSENSVSAALSRMRAELKKYLEKRGYDL